jgi:hypothetical protein
MFQTAKRAAAPLLISISGVSGSGKTYSGLLLAAGLAGPSGRVGFLDTENRRGSMYADDPGIMAAMPGGKYEYTEIKAPFSPDRYLAVVEAAEAANLDVLLIDSFTHEWEGFGGCTEIAERNKLGGMPNWAKAKMEHRKLVNRCLAAGIDLIFSLRAREKARPIKGSKEYEQLGLQPITEKNFVFEMTLSLLVEEGTHYARPLKVPHPLAHLFPKEGALITKETGAKIRQWAKGAAKVDENPADLFSRAEAFARQGSDAYREFFETLAPADKKRLANSQDHELNKELAIKADKQNAGEPEDDEADRAANRSLLGA